jgi:hypothetical protein
MGSFRSKRRPRHWLLRESCNKFDKRQLRLRKPLEMTSREILLDLVESFQEKLTSAEYRQIAEELAKMPPGPIQNGGTTGSTIEQTNEEVVHVVILNDNYELERENELVLTRLRQLSNIPFLISLNETYLLHQLGAIEFLDETIDCHESDGVWRKKRIPSKYSGCTGFWLRVGSSNFLSIRVILRALELEIEPVLLGEDRCILTAYPYDRLRNRGLNSCPDLPFFLIEQDIRYIGRKAHKNISHFNQQDESWRSGTTFIFQKYDTELFILDKVLKHLFYKRSPIMAMGNDQFFVRTTYPYSKYQENSPQEDKIMIPISFSVKDLVHIGIYACENSRGESGTEFVTCLDDTDSIDYILLCSIMDKLGYEVNDDEICHDHPYKDIRGYTTNFPWRFYQELKEAEDNQVYEHIVSAP